MKMIFYNYRKYCVWKTTGTVCNNLVPCNTVYYICYAEILSCFLQYKQVNDYIQQYQLFKPSSCIKNCIPTRSLRKLWADVHKNGIYLY